MNILYCKKWYAFLLLCDKMNYTLTCLANSFFFFFFFGFAIDNINIILLCYKDSHIVSEVVLEKTVPIRKFNPVCGIPRFYAKKNISSIAKV